MATRIENTAAAPAMSQTCGSDPYSFENMLYYQTSLSLLRGMLEQECLDQKAYRKACRILARRYGFPEKSILGYKVLMKESTQKIGNSIMLSKKH